MGKLIISLQIFSTTGKNLLKQYITLYKFGGKQKRPNVHIDDMVRLYVDLSKNNFSKRSNKTLQR